MVVSNSSPLLNLAVIERLELLRDFYETVHIPDVVWNELVKKGKGKPGSKAIASATWVHRHTVQNQHLVAALQEQLDAGESEAIALALEQNATLLLIDETEGRRVAASYDIEKTGTFGILLLAKKRGLIPSMKEEIDKLQHKAHFWVGAQLAEKLLRAAGEQQIII